MFGKINMLTEYTDKELKELNGVKQKNAYDRGCMLIRYAAAGFTITPDEQQIVDSYYSTHLDTNLERKELWLALQRQLQTPASQKSADRRIAFKKKYDKQYAQIANRFDRNHANTSLTKMFQKMDKIGEDFVDANRADTEMIRKLCAEEEDLYFGIYGEHTLGYSALKMETDAASEER